jgi:hypothetical protein
MIGIKVNGLWLSIEKAQRIGIEIVNPIFELERISGVMTFPFKINLNSRTNRRSLGWPDRLQSIIKSHDIANVQLYLMGTLYKIGVLKYRGQSNGIATYNFQTDSGDFSNQVEGVKLRSLDLGTDQMDTGVTAGFYPKKSYALFPILNTEFYADKNPEYWGYINYHNETFRFNTGASRHTRVPFPYLAGILFKVFALYGYELHGDWLQDQDTQRIVMINNYALDLLVSGVNTFNSNITWQNHMPDLTINELILAVKMTLGLYCKFNSFEKKVSFIALDSVVDDLRNNQYEDWSSKAVRLFSDGPTNYKGFTFEMQQDDTDKLLEDTGNDWLQYIVDGGKQKIPMRASPLRMYEGVDSQSPERNWKVPHMLQSASSPEFGLGVNLHPLRLMYYNGMVNGYPLGSYTGAAVDLTLQGANGIFAKRYADWVQMIKNGIPVQRNIKLNMTDLANLDPAKAVYIDKLKFAWRKISLSVSGEGINTSKVDMIKI